MCAVGAGNKTDLSDFHPSRLRIGWRSLNAMTFPDVLGSL